MYSDEVCGGNGGCIDIEHIMMCSGAVCFATYGPVAVGRCRMHPEGVDVDAAAVPWLETTIRRQPRPSILG